MLAGSQRVSVREGWNLGMRVVAHCVNQAYFRVTTDGEFASL
jgi:hypothetical protein